MNQHSRIDRRSALGLASALAATTLPSWRSLAASEAPARTGMGLVIYDCKLLRQRALGNDPKHDLYEPMTFLKHCHTLGAGGMQARLGVLDAQQVRSLRDYATKHELYVEAIISPPRSQADLPRFEAEILTARNVGALAARTVIIPGRRYERFQSLAEFREFEQRGREMLERARPVVEQQQMPLAVENHKDQRIEERVKLFEQLGSEYIGACVDTGNSFALLDDPYEAVEALAPYAFSVHLKDQALQPTDFGFFLGDIPLGQGSFDLGRMVASLKKAKPQVRFSLELITRDPLRVPCFAQSYWQPMPALPARDLARTMRFVNAHRTELQYVSKLSPQQQVDLESNNVAESIRYAGEELGL